MLVVVVHSFLFVLHFVVVLHFCYCSSFIAFQRHHSPFRELSSGFYTHFILSAQPITEWFATLSSFPRSSFIVLPRFEWASFPHRRFLPYTTSPTFYLRLSSFPWEPAVLPWSLQASCWSSKHRPSPSVCLIHSNPQSLYSEEFIFKFYQILSWIACGESLIYLLLTRFELFSLVQSHMERL